MANETAAQKKKREAAEAAAAEQAAAAEETAPDAPALLGVTEKLGWIQTHIGAVAKTGSTPQYRYMEEHGLLDLLRPFLRRVNCTLRISPAETQVRSEGNHHVIEGVIELIDNEQLPFVGRTLDEPLLNSQTGEPIVNPLRSIRGHFANEGVDREAKGLNKAMTMWTKYALQKFFAVPTQAVDDADHPEVRQARAAVASVPDDVPAEASSSSQPTGQGGPVGDAGSEWVAGPVKDAVAAGTLDGAQFKAKLATFGADSVGELSQSDFDALKEWTEDKIAKAQPES